MARAGAAADPPRRLAALLAARGAAHVTIALAAGPLSLAGLLLLAGAAISPTIVYADAMLAAVLVGATARSTLRPIVAV